MLPLSLSAYPQTSLSSWCIRSCLALVLVLVKAISAYIRAILVLLWILVLKMWLTHLTFLASLLVRKFLHHQLVMAVRVLDPATVRVVILVAVNVAGLVAVLQNEVEDHVPDHLVAVTVPVQSSGHPLIEPTRLSGHLKGCTRLAPSREN